MKNNVNDYLRNKIINYLLKKIGIKKDVTLIFTLINIIDVGNILQSTSLILGFNKYLLLLLYFIFIV
jgi:hypothetical protein